MAQAASLRIALTPHVSGLHVLNDLPVVGLPDGAMLELGSFYAGETRRLLVTLQVPGIAALGLAQVATLEFVHVSLPDLVQHTTAMPLHVNVVPGDEAAGRVPDPQVRSEVLFQRTQQAKRESSRLLSQGRIEDAARLLRQTSSRLVADALSLPAELRSELAAEAGAVSALADEALHDSARAAKATSYSASVGSRQRGRTTRGSLIVLVAGSNLLTLEECELQQLLCLLPPELHRALRPSPRPRDGQTARAIAGVLGAGHQAHDFFAGATGGFTVGRA